MSNSMKLSHAVWGHPRRMGHGGEVRQNVVHWRSAILLINKKVLITYICAIKMNLKIIILNERVQTKKWYKVFY